MFKETKCKEIKYISCYPKAFLFACAKKANGVLKQGCDWRSCRETFTRDFYEGLKTSDPKDFSLMIFNSLDKFDFKIVNRRRVIDNEATKVAVIKRREKAINDISRILNTVEKTAGWARSKVLTLGESDNFLPQGGFILIVNCNTKWFASTQLLSLLCLIVRLAATSELPSMVKNCNFNEIATAVPKLIDKGIMTTSAGDLGCFVRTQQVWIPIMLAYKSVFSGSVDLTNMAADQTKGIDSLLRGVAQVGVVEKWKRVEKKMVAKAALKIQNASTITHTK